VFAIRSAAAAAAVIDELMNRSIVDVDAHQAFMRILYNCDWTRGPSTTPR
jgi:hypothetical protein